MRNAVVDRLAADLLGFLVWNVASVSDARRADGRVAVFVDADLQLVLVAGAGARAGRHVDHIGAAVRRYFNGRQRLRRRRPHGHLDAGARPATVRARRR